MSLRRGDTHFIHGDYFSNIQVKFRKLYLFMSKIRCHLGTIAGTFVRWPHANVIRCTDPQPCNWVNFILCRSLQDNFASTSFSYRWSVFRTYRKGFASNSGMGSLLKFYISCLQLHQFLEIVWWNSPITTVFNCFELKRATFKTVSLLTEKRGCCTTYWRKPLTQKYDHIYNTVVECLQIIAVSFTYAMVMLQFHLSVTTPCRPDVNITTF